jgi:hypothetical protein
MDFIFIKVGNKKELAIGYMGKRKSRVDECSTCPMHGISSFLMFGME